jgi:glutamate synthase domain-containing protein 2/glutamate synthase domain-containing protein 1/glutamate synthase domain-containing protein 3
VGFVARLDAQPTHALVEDALLALERMAHRGGAGSGNMQPDGAGVMFPLPHKFMRRVWAPICGDMPEEYGLGQFFLPKDENLCAKITALVEQVLKEHGMAPLGWRVVPVRRELVQETALAGMPQFRQLLIAPSGAARFNAWDRPSDPGNDDSEAFERQLYVIRRHIEQAVLHGGGGCGPDDFHIVSLSSRCVVYKGLLNGGELAAFYPDLAHRDFSVYFALFHERYSTNTAPKWRLAQPFRCLAHNGEINTLSSNQGYMRMHESFMASPLFGDDIRYLTPVIEPSGSDSAMLDNVFELFLRGGRSLAHTAMMLLPEPFGQKFIMGEDKRAFYEYHAAIMEPWDGPAALVFSDGCRQLGAMLDRNALRPCRYVITKDGLVLLASEAGVLDLPAERVIKRGRLQPRRMFLVDFARHRVFTDAECKSSVIYAAPYRHWVEREGVTLRDLSVPAERLLPPGPDGRNRANLLREQHLYGFSLEEVKEVLTPMAKNSQEPVASMGLDTPLAVLSPNPQLLFNYFKQCFAQVTNPPIDPLREGLVMTLTGFIGRRGNILAETPEHYRVLRMSNPVLSPKDLLHLLYSEHPAVRVTRIPMLFEAPADKENAGKTLEEALETLFVRADAAVDAGATIIILSDADADARHAPIPSLLAVSALRHHLFRSGRRSMCSLAVDTGEARDVMQVAQLIAFGAGAVHPRLAFATLDELAVNGKIPGKETGQKARSAYITALQKGLLKTFSRMGISTLRSFNGGQMYEAVGLSAEMTERYFTGVKSRLGGIGLQELASGVLERHAAAFDPQNPPGELEDSGSFRSRPGGEKHLWSATAIRALHKAVRENDLQSYLEYAGESDEHHCGPVTLRSLLRFKQDALEPVPLEEVEPESALLRRFVGAAMSFGAISAKAHEAVAIAFNRIGGRSNCGEGGELEERLAPLPNGDSRRSRTRQIASGRFGVTAAYLACADEIQIKMAQGAKPGEGGQLPGHKVNAEIARVRRTIPGVTLISPPPHHDIYSIEDLAQLIFDLKRLHPAAKISVKLVSGSNIGTIASGVAKAGADNILISGHDGGTGASPRTAITYVGLPWEMGLAETHAALLHNKKRGGITLQVDGQLRTGRDLAVAALLGAEEFGFGSGLLVALGCCMLRVCHLGTCPVGVASQDPRLCARLRGTADHVERYLRFLAGDLRRHMAALGFRALDEMIGRADLLEPMPLEGFAEAHLARLKGLDLSPLLCRLPYNPSVEADKTGNYPYADSQLEAAMLDAVLPAVKAGRTSRFSAMVKNTDRSVCTKLSGEIARLKGETGLIPGSVHIALTGTAGQSAGAFLVCGITLTIKGEANDYVGKGLSGGVIAISPGLADEPSPAENSFSPPSMFQGEQAVIGNVALYGATSGELYVAGSAGERFAVRNSGATAVIEGVGDHGCEYMTGGVVVVLGSVGYNFAAGMSGGAAYVYDRTELFQNRCNMDGVDIEGVWQSEDIRLLRTLLEKHVRYTGSAFASFVLNNWQSQSPLFLKVTPIEYRQALLRMKQSENPEGDAFIATEEVFKVKGHTRK